MRLARESGSEPHLPGPSQPCERGLLGLCHFVPPGRPALPPQFRFTVGRSSELQAPRASRAICTLTTTLPAGCVPGSRSLDERLSLKRSHSATRLNFSVLLWAYFSYFSPPRSGSEEKKNETRMQEEFVSHLALHINDLIRQH